MKIEILCIPDCPHCSGAVALVRDALASLDARAEIARIVVEDSSTAARLGFPGSPTIRVNHRDVEPLPARAGNAAAQCRLYRNSENPGLPPREAVLRAVREALHEERA